MNDTPPSTATRLLSALLATVSGVLVFLSFPNWNIHWLCWFALVPLQLAAGTATPAQGFRIGLLAGFVTNFGGFHWMTEMLREFGHMGMVPAGAILTVQAFTQGLTMAVAVWLWRWLVRRGVPSAVSCFAALWLGEAVIPMIFPWFFGNGISPELEMIQIAELGGVHLVSAMLFASNAAIGELFLALWQRRAPSWRFIAVTVLSVAAAAGWGYIRIPQVDSTMAAAPKLKIGLVEGNVGIWEKEAKYLDGATRARTLRNNLLKHQQMSAQLQKDGAELIVWPESAYQPYGMSPVLHTLDHFMLAGDGGSLWRHDGKTLLAERGDRLGLPRDVGLLTGLSSPRGDIWRAIDRGQRIVTVTPKGLQMLDMPKHETAIATAAPPIDLYGKMTAGYVFTRAGKVYLLDYAGFTPDDGDSPKVALEKPQLLAIRGDDVGAADMTSATYSANGFAVAVGRGGAVLTANADGVTRITVQTSDDLWAVAADPQGALVVAAGANGTVLFGDGRHMVVSKVGDRDWYAAWFAVDGTGWLAGAKGALARRSPGGTWVNVHAGVGEGDFLGGASDADGNNLLVGRGGRAFWQTASGGKFVELNAGSRGEITGILGFAPQASYLVPRSAKRIVPSHAPLPDAKLVFPANVESDENINEFDRTSPRRGFTVPLLFGAGTHGGALPSHHAGCTDCFNSALLLGKYGEVEAIHDKAFLLAFGEYMPFGEMFPKLYELSPETSRYQAGTRTAPIEIKADDGSVRAKLGMLICYEDLVPRYAKRVAAHNPHIFMNLTNDAWFGKTAEPEHHLNLALMRAVEYRRWLIRSTNTGISVFIDAVGRRVAETSLDDAETLLRHVPLLETPTLYATLGDWPLLLLAILVVLLIARAVRGPAGGAKAKKKPKPKKQKAENLDPGKL